VRCFYGECGIAPLVYELAAPMQVTVFQPPSPLQPLCIDDPFSKARMDTGLQIVQLAKAASLHETTIVNWE